MTTTEAEEKRKTCKLCQRKPGYGFCRRHIHRVTMGKITYYDGEEIKRIKEAIQKLANYLDYVQQCMPKQYCISEDIASTLSSKTNSNK